MLNVVRSSISLNSSTNHNHLNMKRYFTILCVLFLGSAFYNTAFSQSAIIEGYAFEADNRGYLRNVKIQILRQRTGDLIAETRSNKDGYFSMEVPRSKEFILTAEKRMFGTIEELVSTIGLNEGEKVFIQLEFHRKPGYIFDVTIAERAQKGEAAVKAITGSRIEIYNNTTRAEELVLDSFPYPTFNFGFEKGNHYTIMIRKKGFLTKRIEAYVNIAGCILCFDGLGKFEPKVTDVMSYGLETGTMLANIEMEPVEINKTFKIENIYYDFDKWNIRSDAAEELDKVITVLKDNPGIKMELGSHTDARGSDSYNLELSRKRAKAAVEYIINSNFINANNIVSKGYGESQLVNKCDDGVNCEEEQHQENRRTELKIIGIAEEDPLDKKSLKDIIEEEKLLEEVLNQEPVKIPENKDKKN